MERGSGTRIEGGELEGGWNAAVICGGVGDDGGSDGDMEDGTKDGGYRKIVRKSCVMMEVVEVVEVHYLIVFF